MAALQVFCKVLVMYIYYNVLLLKWLMQTRQEATCVNEETQRERGRERQRERERERERESPYDRMKTSRKQVLWVFS